MCLPASLPPAYSKSWQGTTTTTRYCAVASVQELFCDLWRALSEGAARCYGACGRRRHAALLHADVADVLMWRGDLAEAAELYSSQCRVALR